MKLRFRLRSLLLIVGLFALVCWAYWIGWPWWQEYKLVSALKQLKAGVRGDEIMQLVTSPPFAQFRLGQLAGKPSGVIMFTVRRGFYFVLLTYPDRNCLPQAPCETVNVYHLPPVPSEYQISDGNSYRSLAEDYVHTFTLTLAYQATAPKFPYPYELIHADPLEAAK
jgi:hypothetical protein